MSRTMESPLVVADVAAILQSTPGGVMIPCRIHPRAAVEGVTAIHDGAVKISLKAPPVEGKANAALLKFLAARLNVAKAAVSLRAGPASRYKLVEVRGLSPAAAAAALAGESNE